MGNCSVDAFAGLSSTDFLCDSAATCHVANNTSLFTELEPLPSGRNDHIMTGAGPLPAEGYGTVLVQDDREQAYMMKNVMYVPKSPVNLFSTTKFNQENGKFCTTALADAYHSQGTLKDLGLVALSIGTCWSTSNSQDDFKCYGHWNHPC